MGFFDWKIVIVLTLTLPSINAYSYNSYPYLYSSDPNSTAPIHDYIAPTLKRKSVRPGFLNRPPPGQYRVVELYVHCEYSLVIPIYMYSVAFGSLFQLTSMRAVLNS
jgi:hypothetical protein